MTMTLTEECRLVKGIRAVSDDHAVYDRVVRAEDLVGGMSESQLDGGVLWSVDAIFVLRMFSRMDGCLVTNNQAIMGKEAKDLHSQSPERSSGSSGRWPVS